MLNNYGVSAPIEIIPTGIDLTRFSQGDPTWLRRELQIDPAEKILLFVGRLTKEKNVELLIRAFAIRKTIREAVLVAGGPKRNI